jgi:chemotaxis protein CheC
MTQQPFSMSVPRAEQVGLEQIPLILGGREEQTVGIYMSVAGDIGGHIAFLLPWPSAVIFWKLLIGAAPEDASQVGEMEASVMLELGNIVNSSFLNAISDMTGASLHATPPMVSIEMAAAILQSIVLEAYSSEHCALSIETRINDESGDAEGYFVFIPSKAGLTEFFTRLGLGEAA